jgi:prepilin-type N-terminal cleavage/methylation domain-containing protein
VKRENKGFTMVELLMVLGIIALLVGILIPALSAVKEAAKNAKQRAQFAALDMALLAFRNDYGDYPPSDGFVYPADPNPNKGYTDYCGAQKLAEAMVGYDLLGFHPKSDWRSDGWDNAGTIDFYDANDPVLLDQRKGPYLDLATASVFRLGDNPPLYPGLFRPTQSNPLYLGTHVLCDVYGFKTIRMPNGTSVRAGSPILYYRANTSGKTIDQIYDVRDNEAIVALKQDADGQSPTKYHPLTENNGTYFYDYITDPRVVAKQQPYKPDSYILISAGVDGLYGTADDIRNFGN